jgi:hypothetical protein
VYARIDLVDLFWRPGKELESGRALLGCTQLRVLRLTVYHGSIICVKCGGECPFLEGERRAKRCIGEGFLTKVGSERWMPNILAITWGMA